MTNPNPSPGKGFFQFPLSKGCFRQASWPANTMGPSEAVNDFICNYAHASRAMDFNLHVWYTDTDTFCENNTYISPSALASLSALCVKLSAGYFLLKLILFGYTSQFTVQCMYFYNSICAVHNSLAFSQHDKSNFGSTIILAMYWEQ